MRGITDIHSHILYRVDDGADSIKTSLELLRDEWDNGVSNVILTPHYDMIEGAPKLSKIQEHYILLKEEAEKILPDMKLYLGNEIMACNDMVDMLHEGEIFTMAETKYILLEFYPTVRYEAIEKHLRNLLNGGFIPIIAHCERYRCLRDRFKVINKTKIHHLVEMGAYLQVNATSVFGREHRFVSKLIDEDLLHFIATDAHNTNTRGVQWEKCIKYLEKKYNKDYIEWLLIRNPQRVIEGKYV